MKKVLLILLCLSMACFAWCSDSEYYNANSHLCAINSHEYLYYYEDTKIVYIAFDENVTNYCGYGYMYPYYSENGKICRYIDGEIVEVNDSNKKCYVTLSNVDSLSQFKNIKNIEYNDDGTITFAVDSNTDITVNVNDESVLRIRYE